MALQDGAKVERQVQGVAWVNVIVNIVLTLGKGVFGFLAGSQALVADAVHSAADVVGSIAVIIGLRIARKPPDRDHPYGHGKAELIAASIVAGFLVAAAIQVGLASGQSLFHPASPPEVSAAWTALIALIVKEILFRHNFRLGTKIRSKSLLASASDHRSDVYSSAAALVGIMLALIGRWCHIAWLYHMDAIASLVVAVLVLKMAYEIATDSLQILMDRVVLDDAALQPYRILITEVSGVCRIDDLRVRDHGQYVIVDVEISVSGDITVTEGHAIAAEVRLQMKNRFARVNDVFVHVNPYYEEGSNYQRD